MNGFTEPLPGLLDDPQFQIPNLPSLPDVHIAPLRNPAPKRHGVAPLPLEPLTKVLEDHRHGKRNPGQLEDDVEKIPPPRLRPSDVLSAREAKKPHLAISELLEASSDADTQQLQLPSFVSLAVVEKSPIQEPTRLSPHKRLRLDLDADGPSRDVGRRLPRPAQKDDKQQRPVPLLPAMVTGLHEPPPSAGILPSMDLDARPNLTKTTKLSKMQVKDMLTEARQSSTHVPPEAMLNTPDLPPAELPKPKQDEFVQASVDTTKAGDVEADVSKKDSKARRARRKWSDEETADLLTGVKKHGFGKWKQILTDAAFTFHDRTSTDLKDRYRVYMNKDQAESTTNPMAQTQNQNQPDAPSRKIDPEKGSEGSSSKPIEGNIDDGKGKRKRRPWTPAEDAGLMRGLSKYGFQWTAIHDDPELGLAHRKATDLRDRIRNLYPEGYKHAEARPSKSETKKLEKTSQDQDTNPQEPKAVMPSLEKQMERSAPGKCATEPASSSQEAKGKARGMKPHKTGMEVHQTAEHAGVTLPSLALDGDDELDWEDNRLPPLLEWEDIGM